MSQITSCVMTALKRKISSQAARKEPSITCEQVLLPMPDSSATCGEIKTRKVNSDVSMLTGVVLSSEICMRELSLYH